MTELEARRLLDEHRSECPTFIVGRRMFIVRRDGRVAVWDAVGKSGKRWKDGPVLEADDWWLPERVRARAVEVKRGSERALAS